MKICLSLKELTILLKLYHHREKQMIVKPPNMEIARLDDLGLVDCCPCDEDGKRSYNAGFLAITITDDGINYYLSAVHDNIRYWVTTGIAVAALAVSIISLLCATR
nr:MAG TPA: hypothetical protein [Caudoviricetes sp.]